MIKFLQTFAVVCFMAFTAIAQEPVSAAKGITYGEKINAKNLIPVNELSAKMANSDMLNTKISGTVTDVCTKKGCWMKLDNGDGTKTMVTFKAFNFDKIEGFLMVEFLDIILLKYHVKHYQRYA